MGIRDDVHALVNQLDERALAIAEQTLKGLRDDGFDLSPEQELELRSREAACDRGETIDARTYLAQLRGEGPAHRPG